MARKPKFNRNAKRKPNDALIDAALLLASREGWQNITMKQIAFEADINLEDALCEFSNKNNLLDAFSQKIDRSVVSGVTFDIGEETPRERLFEIIMRRFDVLTPYKAGLYAVFIGSRYDPISVFSGFNRIHASSRLMLEVAGISSAGCKGQLTVRALALIYANSLRVWFNDETPDLAATMVVLDRGLMRAEHIASLIKI